MAQMRQNKITFAWSITILAFSMLMAAPSLRAKPRSDIKLGILIGSAGDADNPDEMIDLLTSSLTDKDTVPLPWLSRQLLARLSWFKNRHDVFNEFEAIEGGTHYRENSQSQADILTAKMRKKGYWVRGYSGFAFTEPRVSASLEAAQKDGVNRLIVFNQGAQHSRATSHILFREVKAYLDHHPEWQVRVTGVRSFAGDPRFIDLVTASIQDRITRSFPKILPQDICIFLPLPGILSRWVQMGDPAYDQMIYVVDALREHFRTYPVYFGFQNNDDYPSLEWTQPKDTQVLKEVADNACHHVIINGRIGYTVDGIMTLYNQDIFERRFLLEKAIAQSRPKQTIVVEPMFNNNEKFVDFLVKLTVEALGGTGDLLDISAVKQITPPTT